MGNSSSPIRDWVVVGAGGHGREVLDLVESHLLGPGERVLGFLDDAPNKAGQSVVGYPILGPLAWLEGHPEPLSIAMGIGSSAGRQAAVSRLKAMGLELRFPPMVHPSAVIGSRVFLEEGVLVQAGCILTCDIRVEAFAVLNVGVSLSHDVTVGAFSTLAPGSRMAGAVRVGSCVEVGMGTHVIQLLKLGAGCRTGAGAVVISDVSPETTVVGVPAKPVFKPQC